LSTQAEALLQPVLPLWEFPVENSLVVVRPDVAGLFLLNPSARLLWEELRNGASLQRAVLRLTEIFGIPESVARRDVEATIAAWQDGLIGEATPCVLSSSLPVEASEYCYRETRDAVRMDCVLHRRSFRVWLEAGEIAEEIGPRLEGIAGTGEGSAISFRVGRHGDRAGVWLDGVLIADEEKIGGARAILLQEMTRLSAKRTIRAILHAGACGTEAQCVLLAGASHAGKSTLCAALMGAGMTCYADDSAMIDDEFRVLGMPFPLMLRRSGWDGIGRGGGMREPAWGMRWGVESGFLASNLPSGGSLAAPVAGLVFVEYRANARRFEMTPLTVFESLMALRESGFWVEHERESIGESLDWIAGLPRFRMRYSSIDDAVAAVRGLLGFERV
jgi:hypothetical protein